MYLFEDQKFFLSVLRQTDWEKILQRCLSLIFGQVNISADAITMR